MKLNKKAFTLIELLAVIVILAIIALIATPIVLNVIESSKEQSSLLSANNYLDAVDYAVMHKVMNGQAVDNGVYNILEDGSLCSKTTCTDAEKITVEVSGEHPTSGTITVNGSTVTGVLLIMNDDVITTNSEGEAVHYESPCTLAEDSTKQGREIGAKYNCEVKEGTTYTFYVVSKNADGTTNLIMDQNVTKGVKWNEDNDNRQGPVVAMQSLYNATKDWTNIPALNYLYKDIEFHGYKSTSEIGYTSFESLDGIAKIISKTGQTTLSIGSQDKPLRARMPIFTATTNTNSSKNEVSAKLNDGSNQYLYDNLDESYSSGKLGYWTLSSYAATYSAYRVRKIGYIVGPADCKDVFFGVRPVIAVYL